MTDFLRPPINEKRIYETVGRISKLLETLHLNEKQTQEFNIEMIRQLVIHQVREKSDNEEALEELETGADEMSIEILKDLDWKEFAKKMMEGNEEIKHLSIEELYDLSVKILKKLFPFKYNLNDN